MSNNSPDKTNDSFAESDLIMLLTLFYNKRKSIFIILLVFILTGLFIAVFSQKQYTSSTTMVPQINNPSMNMGRLSSLASLAGFNLDMNKSELELSPLLYPKILASTSFQLEIMNAEFEFEELEEKHTLFDYYKSYYNPGVLGKLKKYTIELPFYLLRKFKGEEKIHTNIQAEKTLQLTREQNEIRKKIRKRLNLFVNDKEGYLVLSSSFHQPYLSAQVTLKAQELLQQYISTLKIEKASNQLDFIQQRFEEKKIEFNQAQAKLAKFRDSNKSISSSLAKTEEERLQNEYQIAFTIYSELAKQLEQAKIRVKEETPVFSIIEKVTIPVEKTKPSRFKILFLWFLLGLIVAGGTTYIRHLLSFYKGKWNSTDTLEKK